LRGQDLNLHPDASGYEPDELVLKLNKPDFLSKTRLIFVAGTRLHPAKPDFAGQAGDKSFSYYYLKKKNPNKKLRYFLFSSGDSPPRRIEPATLFL